MESQNPEFTINGRKYQCTRTDTVLFPLSEVIDMAVSLTIVTVQSSTEGFPGRGEGGGTGKHFLVPEHDAAGDRLLGEISLAGPQPARDQNTRVEQFQSFS